ncbi:S41 family peptidase [Flavivirga amylovorans]|uniref:S41 family peptidase n=1 Tax=Flavivirga amylovorans TaxID=870486 RepID=A0ABT8X780_9FLAO|nr:S41 family peptidase [Flavivirga amylovorans]MDO5989697.1 S41 family peptidase [Flavivirga amylovorans]
MKYFKTLILVLTLCFLTTSCFEDDDDVAISTTDINDFVWKGMNSWYNWQTEVPDLSDSKDDNSSEYNSYLNQFTDSEDLFNSLKYETGNVDRFSWFVEDRIAQQQEFQGISKSHGIRYGSVQINSNGDVILYVRYVANNSPASNANIKRGDIINAINGTILNSNNYNNVVKELLNETITLSFVSENGGILTPIEDKMISATVLSENPVYLMKVFNDIGGKKVGYLVYNAFRSSYNDELNAAFSFFKSENINELILDLRINGGGSVSTSAYLASMIYANAGLEKFADLKFNSKHNDEDGFYNFQNTLNVFDSNDIKTGEETINRLNTVNNLYVLTSNSTASASEMVINGLKPFIPVKVIGTTTFGKNVGSITLYDSPLSDFRDRSSANPGHLKAMQPIVFQIFNKNGESDYTQGFAPDIVVKESEFWNNILPLGDDNEVVLKAALDDIRGFTTKTSTSKKASSFMKKMDISVLDNKFEKEMYISNDYFQQKE